MVIIKTRLQQWRAWHGKSLLVDRHLRAELPQFKLSAASLSFSILKASVCVCVCVCVCRSVAELPSLRTCTAMRWPRTHWLTLHA